MGHLVLCKHFDMLLPVLCNGLNLCVHYMETTHKSGSLGQSPCKAEALDHLSPGPLCLRLSTLS